MDREKVIARIWQLHARGQFRLALDELNRLCHRAAELAADWQVAELYAACWYGLGELSRAAEAWWQAIQVVPAAEWQTKAHLFSNYLFIAHYLADMPDRLLQERHFQYEAIFVGQQQYRHTPRSRKKLRIGYISPDFRRHIMLSFIVQLLACRNRDRYEAYCYMTAAPDEASAQLLPLVDGWRELAGRTPAEAARCIYEDQIDILFDLAGHSHGGFTLLIAACKPAPIQLSGLGYFDTTGLAAMDYFLTDGYCDPPGENDAAFRERLVRLPTSQFCYTPSEWVLQCQRPYVRHEPVVFGSFNNFSKITDQMLAAWLRILRQVPGARLILKNPATERGHQNRMLLARARQLGYQEEQLEIRRASGGYLEEYRDMDIALDTYPYPGGGTTCEALYMGVPVISLYGQRHGSRFGYSLLMNVGLGELTARTEEEYIARAVALAKDPELLSGLHQNLRRLMEASPLMDGRGYTRAVEAAYEKMWQIWLNQQPALQDN